MPRASSGAPHSDSSSGALVIAFGFCLLFFGWPGAAGFKFPRPSAKGRGGACTVLELARSPAAGVGALQGQLVAPQAEIFRGGGG